MRVLELSDIESAAAVCGKLFLRAGAEVIKVERPDRTHPDRSLDLYLNAGKRRVALDFRDEGQRDLLARLAAGCDVLVTDAAAVDVTGYALLELGDETGPRVRTSITPFGLSGPYADWQATSATLLALAGHTWLSGDPGRAPLTMPGDYPGYQAGTFGFVGSMAALLGSQARSDSSPQTLEVSVFECLAALHQFTDTMWTFGGQIRSRHGNSFENIAPTGLFRCADGWVGVHAQQNFWEPFTRLIGHLEFAEAGHPFSDNDGRMTNQDELATAVAAALKPRTRRDIFHEAQGTWRITMGFVASLQDALDDPHLTERGFWQPLAGSAEAGAGHPLRTAAAPFRLAGEERPPEPAVSAVGAESDELLRGLPARGRPAASNAVVTAPLKGVRVLDLTRVWSGPLATRILADLGAEVIKIESIVPTGSQARMARSGSRPAPSARGMATGAKLNRNKRSVAIDLKHPEGHALFLSLVAESDVVIENFSAPTMPSLDLGYERLREANDRIVYLSMPAYGASGPYREYIGYGPSVEPMTGLTALMGYSDEEPRATATALPDAAAGTTAAAAVLHALERRRRTGSGAFIDLSQHEATIAFWGEHFIERQLTGAEPIRIGNRDRVYAPRGVYRCAGEDNWIAIDARDEWEWRALSDVASRDWAAEAVYSTTEGRLEHGDALDEAIEDWTRSQDKIELTRVLQSVGVPAGAVHSAPEWLEDPQLEARDYFAELDHPLAGRARWDGSPILFGGRRGYERWSSAPTLGADNEAVLAEVLGLGSEAVADLLQRQIIGRADPG